MNKRTCTISGCPTRHYARGWCRKHYARWDRTGSVSDPEPIADHFTRYIPAPSGCWVWAGPLFQTNGYGQLSRAYRGTKLAHRAFYFKFVGPIPDGMQLDHLCRNRTCVNPTHLDPVTQRVNMLRGLSGYTIRNVCKAGLHNIKDPDNWYIPPGNPNSRTCYPCSVAKWRRQELKRVSINGVRVPIASVRTSGTTG